MGGISLLVAAVLSGAPHLSQGARGTIPGANEKLDVRLLYLVRSAALYEFAEFVPVDIVLAEQCPAEALAAAASLRSKRDQRELVISLLRDTALASQGPLVQTLEAWRGEGRVRGRIDRLWIHNVVSAEVRLADVTELAARSDVALVHHDPPRGEEVLLGAPAAPEAPPCGLTRIRAPEVWDRLGVTGSGVVVGVIDTGVCEAHPDIRDRLWKNTREIAGNGLDDDHNGFVDDIRGWNFRSDSADLEDMSPTGHGSFVHGIVAGTGLTGTPCGVAPGAELMTLRILDEYSGEAIVWRAIEYGVANGADVLTGSLGWPSFTGPRRAVWRRVCEAAIAAGTVVLFAGGNDGCNTNFRNIWTPANVPDVIAVGAVNCQDLQTSFSSCGPVTWENVPPYFDFPFPPGLTKPDVAAPGFLVTSHLFCDGYQMLSGTSTATPHVAGVVALMLEVDPTLDHFDVRRILEQSAVDLGVPGKDNRYGSGRIDAYAAVQLALAESSGRRRH